MKTKFFFITLIFFYFNQSLFSNDSVYNADQENIYWEFIKERLLTMNHNLFHPFSMTSL
jgi:hypothetical protein